MQRQLWLPILHRRARHLSARRHCAAAIFCRPAPDAGGFAAHRRLHGGQEPTAQSLPLRRRRGVRADRDVPSLRRWQRRGGARLRARLLRQRHLRAVPARGRYQRAGPRIATAAARRLGLRRSVQGQGLRRLQERASRRVGIPTNRRRRPTTTASISSTTRLKSSLSPLI